MWRRLLGGEWAQAMIGFASLILPRHGGEERYTRMTFFPSACIWNFKGSILETLPKIRHTAFHYIDVETEIVSPEAQRMIGEQGLKVSCVALDHHLPAGSALEGATDRVRKAVTFLKQSLDKCRELGAKRAYVAPCSGTKHLDSYRGALIELAEDAGRKGIKLCIEPVPGSALPGAGEALAFIEKTGHANLYLLLDTGHALLSKEKPHDVIRAAGIRLGYVQMSDNDGKKDRHWALLDGRLKEEDIVQILEALRQVGYEGTLGLELSGSLPILISSLARNRNLLMRLQAPVKLVSG